MVWNRLEAGKGVYPAQNDLVIPVPIVLKLPIHIAVGVPHIIVRRVLVTLFLLLRLICVIGILIGVLIIVLACDHET